MYQRVILALWIADDNVILRQQKAVEHFPLACKRFARTGLAENDAVRVVQVGAAGHDDVVRQGIEAIVKRVGSRLEQLLRGERNENTRGRGGQPALDFNLIDTQRQGRRQSFLLLKIQCDQMAALFLRQTAKLQQIIFHLLAGVRRGHNEKSHHEQMLVMAFQRLKQLFYVHTVGFQTAGQDVDVVARAHGLFLLIDFGLVQVGHFALDHFQRFHMIDSLNVQGYDHAGVQLQQFRQHAVGQFRRVDLQHADRGQLSAHGELPPAAKLKAAGCNEVFGGQSCRREPAPIKLKGFIGIVHVEDTVQQF